MPSEPSTSRTPAGSLSEFLERNSNTWIDDAVLIAEHGDNAVELIRGLRRSGMQIMARPNPISRGLQWKLVRAPDETFPLEAKREGDGQWAYRLAQKVACFECGDSYWSRATHEVGQVHQKWLMDQTKRPTQTVLLDEIPDEPTEPFQRDPAHLKIEFGKATTCPRCHGVRRPVRYSSKGTVIPADGLCMDPEKRDVPCRRCRGFGVVQVGEGGNGQVASDAQE